MNNVFNFASFASSWKTDKNYLGSESTFVFSYTKYDYWLVSCCIHHCLRVPEASTPTGANLTPIYWAVAIYIVTVNKQLSNLHFPNPTLETFHRTSAPINKINITMWDFSHCHIKEKTSSKTTWNMARQRPFSWSMLYEHNMTFCVQRVLGVLSLSTFAEMPHPIPSAPSKDTSHAAVPSFPFNTFAIGLFYMIPVIDLVTAQPADSDLCLVDRDRSGSL